MVQPVTTNPPTNCPTCGGPACPSCGAHTFSGYGFAGGGGLGTYTFCSSEGCDWSIKVHDDEDVPHVEEKKE